MIHMGTSKNNLVAATAAVVITAGLAGCGGGNDRAAAGPSADVGTVPAPQSDAKSDPEMDATGVLAGLISAGLPAKSSVVFTEESDPNALMGRPGQYTSKLAFIDTTLDPAEVSSEKGDTERGGGIEVFPTAAAAKNRLDYITSITEAMPIVAEYTYQNGNRLLRLSHYLTPAQARVYKGAFDAQG